MLGAKDVAFPKLNLMSYYLWITGAIFFVMAIIGVPGVESMSGGLDTGWTFYTPYSSTDPESAMGGVIMPRRPASFILGFSSIFTGMNFLVTMHRLRPPGMTWFRMPLFLWSLYATAVIQVLATPVLAVTLLLLDDGARRSASASSTRPSAAIPVLYQHFFWFYSPPRRVHHDPPGHGHHLRAHLGPQPQATSSATGSSPSAPWRSRCSASWCVGPPHVHVGAVGPDERRSSRRSPSRVSIPSAIKVFNWVATLYKGAISFNTPMLYALSFIFIFSIGGLTGLHLGTLATDIHLHDTYFVVAHFHYVMMGSALIAMIGGLHHWWPKITGRMYSENGWPADRVRAWSSSGST